MISKQIKTMTFVNGLIPVLKKKVRPLVNWEMHFDKIVSIAEKIQSTTKLTTLQQPPHKQKQFKQCSQGKRMQFSKSDYKVPPNVSAAQRRGAPHPEATNSVYFVHFPKAKKDNNKYKTYGLQNPERDQLAMEGKCFLCKKPDHMARDSPTMQVSTSYQQVNRKPMYKVKTVSLSVESEVDTLHLQVKRPPTKNRKAIILGSQKICNAVEISINGYKAHALIDPCTINGDLISVKAQVRDLHKMGISQYPTSS